MSLCLFAIRKKLKNFKINRESLRFKKNGQKAEDIPLYRNTCQILLIPELWSTSWSGAITIGRSLEWLFLLKLIGLTTRDPTPRCNPGFGLRTNYF